MSPSSLASFIGRFTRANILVIGDLMLDEFVFGKVDRISPEAPVPVVWVESESHMPGGAANVALNIRSLGGDVQLAGCIGEGRMGDILLGQLQAHSIDSGLLVRSSRPTTVKTRVIAHGQQVVRVDREVKEPLPEGVCKRLIDRLRPAIKQADAVIIEDYGKGVITRQLLEAVIPLARRHKKVITVDPKEEHFDLYKGVTALTPNRKEAENAVGRELPTPDAIERAGKQILRELRSDGVLITLGEGGMQLFQKSGKQTHIPTVAQEVFDVAGAGDTVIAAFTLALASGASMEQSARLSNFAAGIAVEKLGVACVGPEELRGRVERVPRPRKPKGR